MCGTRKEEKVHDCKLNHEEPNRLEVLIYMLYDICVLYMLCVCWFICVSKIITRKTFTNLRKNVLSDDSGPFCRRPRNNPVEYVTAGVFDLRAASWHRHNVLHAINFPVFKDRRGAAPVCLPVF